MGKGTPSQGSNHTPTHIRCRRCGHNSYNIRKSICAQCGFGNTARIRQHNW